MPKKGSVINLYIVVFSGDRNWTAKKPVIREMKQLIKVHGVTNLLIVEGGAVGLDLLSKDVAHALNVHVAQIDALWMTRKNGAGPQRNMVMRALYPDEVICFHDDIEKSKGTKGMRDLAIEWDIPVKVVTSH